VRQGTTRNHHTTFVLSPPHNQLNTPTVWIGGSGNPDGELQHRLLCFFCFIFHNHKHPKHNTPATTTNRPPMQDQDPDAGGEVHRRAAHMELRRILYGPGSWKGKREQIARGDDTFCRIVVCAIFTSIHCVFLRVVQDSEVYLKPVRIFKDPFRR
jgi:hypothetical protein